MSRVACVFRWPIISINVNLLFLSAFRTVGRPCTLDSVIKQQIEQAPLNANDNNQTLLQQ